MGFRCGIVGLPNVGKSTFFNAITNNSIQAENYPFCTIEPNVGIVAVPDMRLQQLADCVSPDKIVPTTLGFVDIAGLVKGASKGEGLGNQFLANIRETDAIAQVVRCFENPDIIHVAGRVDPIDDAETINLELILADLQTVEKALQKLEKKLKTHDKLAIAEHAVYKEAEAHLAKGFPLRQLNLDNKDKVLLKRLGLITNKPLMYIANVDEAGFTNNPALTALQAFAQKEQAPVVPICAALEAEMTSLNAQERHELLSAYGLEKTGLEQVIQTGYLTLELLTFFTAGPKEVHAWTVESGARAPEAAGVIHTDFQKGFIRAEVIHFKDFIECKNEQGAKEAGKLNVEGKDYIVQEGDVMHFRFNV